MRDDSGGGGEGVRRLLNTATGLALALGVAVVVCWARSYVVSDSIYRSQWWIDGSEHNESAWWFFAGRGRVGIGHRRQQVFQPSHTDDPFLKPASHRDSSWNRARPAEVAGTPFAAEGFFQYLGFRYADFPHSASSPIPNNYYREWNAPFWVLLFLVAPLPIMRFGSAMRRRRARGRGLCAACGYDLRATPGRCPECGAVYKVSLKRSA